jgi:hypothetical protein
VGVIASSKTESRPVWARRVAGSLGRKIERNVRPRERTDVLGSSSSVNIGGTKRFQEDLMIDS